MVDKPERLALARLVLQHRLDPVDPLATDADPCTQAEDLLLGALKK